MYSPDNPALPLSARGEIPTGFTVGLRHWLRDAFEYIEVFYNRQCLNYLCPHVFEATLTSTHNPAPTEYG